MQNKAEILARLQNDIHSLQGFKPGCNPAQTDFGLGCIVQSFPNSTFSLSALHEFTCNSKEECAASKAFIAGLLSASLNKAGLILWAGTKPQAFPPALKAFGIDADQIIFTSLNKEKDVVWAIEEAIKCATLTTVIGEVSELDFTGSRRLQLAIEKTGVGCFLLRNNPQNLSTASTSRWNVKPLPSVVQDDLPGVGYPRWQVNLLKVRNGKPGSWIVEWAGGRFRHPSTLTFIRGEERQTRTG